MSLPADRRKGFLTVTAGLLLAPAYDIDYAPLDNVVAFVEAAEEFGRIC